MASTQEENFIPQLVPEKLTLTAGWTGFSQVERKWIQEHTTAALTAFRESGLKALAFCMELAAIQTFLEGKSMTFTNWVRTCFGSNERTAYNWLASYRELRQTAPDAAIAYLAQEGLVGVNNARGPRELTPILKALPAPKGSDKKALEAWRVKVSEELRAKRSRSRKRVSLHLKDDDAIKVWIITTRRIMREAKLSTSAEQRAFLKKGGGYLFQLLGTSGSVTIERTPIPDGFMPKVGRPRKKRDDAKS